MYLMFLSLTKLSIIRVLSWHLQIHRLKWLENLLHSLTAISSLEFNRTNWIRLKKEKHIN